MFSSVSSAAYSYLWGGEQQKQESNESKENSSNNDMSVNRNNNYTYSNSYPTNDYNSNNSSSNLNNNNNNNSKGSLRSQFKKKMSLKNISHYSNSSSNSNSNISMDEDENEFKSSNDYCINNNGNVRNYYSNSVQKKYDENNSFSESLAATTMATTTTQQTRERGSAALLSSHSLSVLFDNEDKNINEKDKESSDMNTNEVINSNKDNKDKDDPFQVTHYVFGGYLAQQPVSVSMSPSPANGNSNSNIKDDGNNTNGTRISAFDDKFDNNNNSNSSNSNVNSNNNKKNDNNKLISNYFDTLELTKKERRELEMLHNWVKQDKLSMKMAEELCLGDLILSYFSSFSKTNPDAQGCWKRWIQYRHDNPILKDVNYQRIKEFFDSGVVSVGHGYDGKPFIILNTQYYDDSFGPEVVAKAMILLLTSCIWDLKKDEFNYAGLRHGVSAYINLSHWSVNMMSWRILKAAKAAIVAFPYATYTSYCVNAPTLIYLLRQFAAKVLVPHAIDKFQILTSMEELFDSKIAPKHAFPVECGGTSRLTASKWLQDRGYLECIE